MSIIRSAWVWGATILCAQCTTQIRSGEAYYAIQQGLIDDLALASVLRPVCYHTWCLDSINLVLSLVEDETLCITYMQS